MVNYVKLTVPTLKHLYQYFNRFLQRVVVTIKGNWTILINKCGIYAIVNTVTGERYIGSSSKITERFTDHRWNLRRGTHHSASLQKAWNTYGEDKFLFIILEEVLDIADLESVEQVY